MDPTFAQQLKIAFKDSEPLKDVEFWKLLHPPARLESDGLRHTTVHESLRNLWNNIKGGEVRDRAELESWARRARYTLVSCTVGDPRFDC